MSLGTDPASGTEPGFRSSDPIVEAANERRRNRALALAGLAAGAVGLIAVAWALFGQTRAPAPGPQRAPAGQVVMAPPAPLPPPMPASYAPPDQAAVARGYADVGRVYRAGGASELARTSRDCFERLQRAPAYALLDYCLAFDAFAAAALRREADMDILPSGSWFDAAPQRGLRVAQAMMGPEGDAAARLLDIRRMALGLGGTRQIARADPTPAIPALRSTAPSEGLQVEVRSTRGDQLIPTPAISAPVSEPVRVRDAAPDPRPRAQPASTASRGSPQPIARREAERSTPPLREMAAAAPPARRVDARPSFACSAAQSRSERLVCRDPDLARMDRQLNRAFEDAVASGVPRRALRREQDSWLAVRESAADDPDAVADVYAVRIQELREMAEPPPDED